MFVVQGTTRLVVPGTTGQVVPGMTRFVVSLQWLVYPISVSYIKVSVVDLPPAGQFNIFVFLVSSLYKLYTEISIIM